MTPFDRIALQAMLEAFYPVVSAAMLAQARRERPEYFAGGRLVGSKGDKLELPDGRVFDLIRAAGGPASDRRWQVIEPDPNAPIDPWALEEGPLTPLDEDAPLVAGTVYGFEALVTDAHAQLAGVDGAIDTHAQSITSVSSPDGLDHALAAAVDDGGTATDNALRGLETIDAAALVTAAEDATRQIDDPQDEWDAQNVGNLPDLPDDLSGWIGYVPQDEGPEPGPGPQPHDT